MKKYLTFLGLVVAIASFNFGMAEKPSGALFSWSDTTYDFGEIEINQPVTTEFSFENAGDSPLMILSAKGSCGCTVVDFTKGEILPGESGTVNATFNAAKAGVFSKTITVTANTPNGSIVLSIKGEVID